MARTSAYVPGVAACLAVSLLVIACGSGTAGDDTTASTAGQNTVFPITFTECGESFTFDQPPKILVDLPQAAGLVAAAGGNRTGRVVAYTEGGDEPLGDAGTTLDGVPRTSKTSPPTKDVILAAAPDLVITHYLDQGLKNQLSALGIRTMTVNNGCESYPAEHGGRTGYDAIYSDIELIGRLLGTEDHAAQSVSTMKETIDRVGREAKGLTRRNIAVLSPYAGKVYSFGAQSLEETELRTLNMTNAFSDLDGSFVPVSGEALVAADPWAIVISYSPGTGTDPQQSEQALMALPGADQLSAIKNKRVILMDNIYFTARPADGVELLYDKLRTPQ